MSKVLVLDPRRMDRATKRAIATIPDDDWTAIKYPRSGFNLTCAVGTLASKDHARARTGTMRNQLTAVPARIATTARRLQPALAEYTCIPPQTATT